MSAETTIAVDAAVLTVNRRLDAAVGGQLLAAARAAVEAGALRLDIDLCDVAAYTQSGAAALLACRDLRTRQDPGKTVDVHYRTNRGPGREALLAAFAGVCDDDGRTGVDGPVIDLRAR